MRIEEESSVLDFTEDDKSSTLDSLILEETPTPKAKRLRRTKKQIAAEKDAVVAAKLAKKAERQAIKASKEAKAAEPIVWEDRTDDAAKLIWRHCQSFKRVLGRDYTPSFGADVKAAKAATKMHGLDKCLEYNDAFFASHDQFIMNSDYDFCTFKGLINRLILAAPTAFENNLRLEDLT